MLIGEVSDPAREERLRLYAERASRGLGIFDGAPLPPGEPDIYGLDAADPEVIDYENGEAAVA